MATTKLPISLLTRIAGGWDLVRGFRTLDAAERYVKSHYCGPWTWWGPSAIAQRMIADPSYVHGESKESR